MICKVSILESFRAVKVSGIETLEVNEGLEI